MEKKETLRQYLSYNKDFSQIEQIFINLDMQMKYYHQKGFCIKDLNSDSILLDQNNGFEFSFFIRSNSDKDKTDNILALSKLAVGAYISPETGFFDYSQLPADYLKRYFNEISVYLPNKDYFSKVIMDNDISYYSDYINELTTGNSRSNAIQKRKSTEYGKMYVPEEDAAFIQIVFYPVMIISVITVIAVLSKILS